MVYRYFFGQNKETVNTPHKNWGQWWVSLSLCLCPPSPSLPFLLLPSISPFNSSDILHSYHQNLPIKEKLHWFNRNMFFLEREKIFYLLSPRMHVLKIHCDVGITDDDNHRYDTTSKYYHSQPCLGETWILVLKAQTIYSWICIWSDCSYNSWRHINTNERFLVNLFSFTLQDKEHIIS